MSMNVKIQAFAIAMQAAKTLKEVMSAHAMQDMKGMALTIV